jgi:hypothetical protein
LYSFPLQLDLRENAPWRLRESPRRRRFLLSILQFSPESNRVPIFFLR